ncbi:kinase-like protein [Pyrenochaeta sp. DS3sAY3a]|nr:kinase-like protein [Pyrenochaeta sp. DS3sAY3a]
MSISRMRRRCHSWNSATFTMEVSPISKESRYIQDVMVSMAKLEIFEHTTTSRSNVYTQTSRAIPAQITCSIKKPRYSRSLSRTHDHIVSLLMTWTYRGNYFLLFPLSDGNLRDFWSAWNPRNPEPEEFDNHSTARWMSEQVTGLISAVYTIHHPQGVSSTRFSRHGDLKPENILWYKNGNNDWGTLVISDFGSSTTSTRLTRSNIPLDRISMTPTYRPPEYDFGDRGASRADDIWSLGCVLLELVCWGLGGGEMVRAFEQDRILPYSNGIASDIFFEANVMPNGRHLVRVNRQVSAYIAQLHQHEHCTRFHHDILDIIENDMLVVVSPERQRITSNELVKKYSEVHFMVKSSDGYCTTSCPETRPVQTKPFFEAKLRSLPFGQGHRRLSVAIPLAEATAAKTDIQIITHRSVPGAADHEDKRPNQTPLRPADALHSQEGADGVQNLIVDSGGSYTLPLSLAWKRERDRLQIQLQHATYHPQRILKRISRSYKHRSYDVGRRIQQV